MYVEKPSDDSALALRRILKTAYFGCNIRGRLRTSGAIYEVEPILSLKSWPVQNEVAAPKSASLHTKVPFRKSPVHKMFSPLISRCATCLLWIKSTAAIKSLATSCAAASSNLSVLKTQSIRSPPAQNSNTE